MKKLQEFTDNGLVPSVETLIKQIIKLPLPYTGNKKKLLYHMHDAINKYNLQFDTVLDAFTGSASVAMLFKLMGKKVIANDLLTSSYMNAVAFAENPGIKLSEDDKNYLLYHDNTHKGSFVQDNYLGQNSNSVRFKKFTLKECQHLDNFRANVDELCGIYPQSLSMAANAAVVLRLPFGNVDQSHDILKHRKKQAAAYGEGSEKHDRRIGIYYDADLNLRFDKWFPKYVNDFMSCNRKSPTGSPFEQKIKRAAFLANLQQHVLRDCMVAGRLHQGQALAEVGIRLKHQKNQLKAHWSNEGSTEMDFFTKAGSDWTDNKPGQGMRWWTFADLDFSGSCLATNMDIIALLNTGIKVDCAYFDPPYGGGVDYASIYRFLEEYIYSTPLEDLPHIKASANRFVKNKGYEEHFRDMLQAATQIPLWIFSYNNYSWRGVDDIVEIIRDYKDDVQVEVLDGDYRYLYRKKQGRDSRATEYLIIAR